MPNQSKSEEDSSGLSKKCRFCGITWKTARGRKVHERTCPIGKKIRDLEAERKDGAEQRIAEAAIGPAAEPEVGPAAEPGIEPAVEIKISAEVVERFLLQTSEVLAVRAGEHWRLEKIEAASLAVSWADCINVYYPTISSRQKVLYLALFNSAMILGPRIGRSASDVVSAIRKRRERGRDDRGPGRHGQDYPVAAVSQEVAAGSGI